MKKRHFIFEPGIWIGEGKITFSASPEHVNFYLKWTIQTMEDHRIRCDQQVEMQGVDENTFNSIIFSNITPEHFQVTLENNLLGKIVGTGVIDEDSIGWEYRGDPEFEGFEIYHLHENGEYDLHAEYTSTEQYRTIIDAKIWKKGT